MKTITVNEKTLQITAPEQRAIETLIKRGASPMSAFQEGTSKKWLRTCLPLDSDRQAELGIIVTLRHRTPDHVFWLDNPRHSTVVEGGSLTALIHKALSV